jgi:gamma-glutamyltranspeptidase / glutathione hydrolase
VMILNNKITILKKAKGYFKRTKNKWSMTVIIKSHRTLRPLVQWALILALFGVQSTVLAVESAIIDSESRSHPVHGSLGMVVSQEIVASRVGADILSQGGNAIDAAVATGFALAVTLPRAGNLAGGGFMLVHLAEEKKTIALDYREMAPASASRDMFLKPNGEVDNQLARDSIKSSGVPGTVAGLLYAHEKYGRLSLKQVIQPAIHLASEGISVSVDLSYSLKSRATRLRENPATSRYFFRENGAFYEPGDTLVQSDLADTMRRIVANGRSGFYQGKTAQLIIDEMERSGGLISFDDLKNYHVVERAPVCVDFKKNEICSMPPPSSGGIHLLQMLNILERWDLQSLGHNSAAYIHRLVESMRRAYADRSAYLGDPDFYSVPVKQIIDKRYAKKLRRQIDLEQASSSDNVLPGLPIDPKTLVKGIKKAGAESIETTHISTWDQWGNVVSTTTTLNFSFGSGISVSGAGFLLNNEMDDFSAKPGSPNGYGLIGGVANEIQPGKRPLSAMTPTIVFDQKGAPILATGSPGGSTIITAVLQVLLNILEFNMGIADATAAPRIHHQWLPDRIEYEPGISPDTLNLLKEMGHSLDDKPRILGSTQTVHRGTKGSTMGASDTRRDGAGAVAQK